MPVYRTLRFPDIATVDSTQVNSCGRGRLVSANHTSGAPKFQCRFAPNRHDCDGRSQRNCRASHQDGGTRRSSDGLRRHRRMGYLTSCSKHRAASIRSMISNCLIAFPVLAWALRSASSSRSEVASRAGMCSSRTGFRWHSYRRQAVPQLRNDLGRRRLYFDSRGLRIPGLIRCGPT
jgi:hypothetical protein